jgi:hypothetical protein
MRLKVSKINSRNKVYKKPKLKSYGTLFDLTEAATVKGGTKADGAGKGASRTSGSNG